MRAITAKNISLVFDADEITEGNDRQQVIDAIEMINGTLQREPYGLGAQLVVVDLSESDISSEEVDEEEDTEYKDLQECIIDKTHLTKVDDDGYCKFCGEQSPVSVELDGAVTVIKNLHPCVPMTLKQIESFLAEDWSIIGMNKPDYKLLIKELNKHAEKVGWDCLYSVLNP